MALCLLDLVGKKKLEKGGTDIGEENLQFLAPHDDRDHGKVSLYVGQLGKWCLCVRLPLVQEECRGELSSIR